MYNENGRKNLYFNRFLYFECYIFFSEVKNFIKNIANIILEC